MYSAYSIYPVPWHLLAIKKDTMAILSSAAWYKKGINLLINLIKKLAYACVISKFNAYTEILAIKMENKKR
jgi:hypothetical protein